MLFRLKTNDLADLAEVVLSKQIGFYKLLSIRGFRYWSYSRQNEYRVFKPPNTKKAFYLISWTGMCQDFGISAPLLSAELPQVS